MNVNLMVSLGKELTKNGNGIHRYAELEANGTVNAYKLGLHLRSVGRKDSLKNRHHLCVGINGFNRI